MRASWSYSSMSRRGRVVSARGAGWNLVDRPILDHWSDASPPRMGARARAAPRGYTGARREPPPLQTLALAADEAARPIRRSVNMRLIARFPRACGAPTREPLRAPSDTGTTPSPRDGSPPSTLPPTQAQMSRARPTPVRSACRRSLALIASQSATSPGRQLQEQGRRQMAG